jgi:ABC-2 type transport system ATP-binding protein
MTVATLGSSTTIEAISASKWFGDKVAVSEVSFALGPGVTTLLGPNGAGKTTTLRMLAGMLRPSHGSVRVLGEPAFGNAALYRHIGLVPEQEGIYPFLSALQFVELAARLSRVQRPLEAAREALRTVDLLDVQNRKVGTFSKGMRQRAKIAQALVHNPPILLLDEPLSGADPVQRLALMDMFLQLGASGRTVLISSHILNEAEHVGSNILVIVNGKLAARGDYHAIRALMDDRPRRVRITCTSPRAVAAGLVMLAGVRGVHFEDDGLLVETTDVGALGMVAPRAAQQSEARLYGLEGLDEDLESVFRYLVT